MPAAVRAACTGEMKTFFVKGGRQIHSLFDKDDGNIAEGTSFSGTMAIGENKLFDVFVSLNRYVSLLKIHQFVLLVFFDVPFPFTAA